MHLNQTQIRVLGCLVEKEITTPENYPLSLNSLINACNQRSSRDPVMDLSEEEVRQALHALEELGLTSTVRDSRVAKFEHRARTVLNLRRDETAVLMADPFLAEIAAYTSQLDALQRSIFLNHVRELAAGRRRTA